MPRVVVKVVGKLGKNFGQVSALPTVSTCHSIFGFSSLVLSSRVAAANAQFSTLFTQAFSTKFNQLNLNLYPVSTRPTNNTNLIKGL